VEQALPQRKGRLGAGDDQGQYPFALGASPGDRYAPCLKVKARDAAPNLAGAKLTSAIDVCLTGHSSLVHTEHALAALEKGPMDVEELAWMRRVGDAIYGKRR
jgi:hypothetical protein